MSSLVLSRLRLRRRVPYWVAAGAVALLTAAVVARLVGDTVAERARWGDARAVLVTTTSVAVGERLAGHVAARRLPVAALPDRTLDVLPPGAVAAVDLGPGEVVVARRLARRSGVAARLPSGTRGVAVPIGPGLPVGVGDRVDVLATFDVKDTGGDPTVTVTRDALVVATGKDTVTIAVDAGAATRVAYALAAGTVMLVLSG